MLACSTAAVAGSLLAGAGAASSATTYPDIRGDLLGRTGPDIVSVTASHTAAAVTFRVTFAKAPPLRANAAQRWLDVLALALDVPPKGPAPTSAGWNGADYSAGALGSQKTGSLSKAPRWTTVARFAVRAAGRTLTFAIPRSRIGNPAWFDFVVAAGRSGTVSDSAPNGGGTFRYRLSG